MLRALILKALRAVDDLNCFIGVEQSTSPSQKHGFNIGPLTIVFDDLHHLDTISFETVVKICANCPGLLVIATLYEVPRVGKHPDGQGAALQSVRNISKFSRKEGGVEASSPTAMQDKAFVDGPPACSPPAFSSFCSSSANEPSLFT
jgi:hypothetical protein